MDQADTEQLVVGQDARDRRRRLARWIANSAAFLVIITLLLAILVSLRNHSDDGPQAVPSKLVVKDSRVRIQLGVGEESGLISDVQIESTGVGALTIHVLEAKVSRGKEEEGEEGQVGAADKASQRDSVNNVIDSTGDDDELVGLREDEPALKYDKVQSSTGTFLNFFISSNNRRMGREQGKKHEQKREAAMTGRLRLRIEVPIEFSGELTIDGSYLNIDGSSSLGQARFNLLHLSTIEGSITLGNSTSKTTTTMIHPPALQVANLYARVHQKGSVHVGMLGAAEKGKPCRVNIETQQGDISIDALQTMLDFDSSLPYPEDEEVVHFFNLVTHQGNIQMDLREGENLFGPWYIRGMMLVIAQAKGGSIHGQVAIPDLQSLFMTTASDQETVLEVSDKFIGAFMVGSSRSNATVVPMPGSKHLIRYSHSDEYLKRGKKVRKEDDYTLMGWIHVQAVDGPAKVAFV
ncbi:hypothetical protein BGX23_002813 [Mortierella sp. AD031]|nr:hypothetical protein BGX23_002813 [Mortierella sp. AD031]KAG0211786.1 hypothetical protein BGX33_004063 [Mortierella sp. NVP41]